jgi:aspartate aminotransferase
MPQFDPASALSSRANMADEGAIIRMAQRTRDLRSKGHDVVSLTIGEPDFDTPRFVQEAATAAMKKGLTHYSPVPGIPELRQAISEKLKTENNLDYAPNEIAMANGVKQAIANAVLSLVEPGDEVIMLAPFWVSYEMTVRLAGGVPVILHAGIDDAFKVPARKIANALTGKSKLLIINSPNNPTGAVWSKAELEKIAALVRAHPHLMVLADEIYEYIVFESEVHSIGALPGMKERTVTVNGFSKSFAMTGWRLGYAAAPEPIAKACSRMQSAISAGANSFVQHAALAALKAPRTEVHEMVARYRARRDIVMAGLARIAGVKTAPIAATFYAFPDVSAVLGGKAGNRVIANVAELCDWLLEDHGVATVPGSAFGDDNCIRLSFAAGEKEIRKALQRLERAFGSLDRR